MTLNEWISRQEESKLQFMRTYDKLGWSPIEDITHLPFIYVKEKIPKLLEDGLFDEAFSLTLSKPMAEVLKIPPLDRFRLFVWLENQYKRINKMEEVYLHSEPDFKLLGAGIRDLDILGIVNIIDILAGGDVTKWEQVKMLPYSSCFEKQMKMTIEKKIENKLIEQQKNK